MDRDTAQELLAAVASGEVDPADALDRIATAPYDALAHSLVDLHRELRTGDPEVVYGAGKTTAQVLDVVEALRAGGDRGVLVTRAEPDTVAALRAAHDDVLVDGRTVVVGPLPRGTGHRGGARRRHLRRTGRGGGGADGAGLRCAGRAGRRRRRRRAAPADRCPAGARPRGLPRRRRRHGGRAAVRRRRARRDADGRRADERRATAPPSAGWRRCSRCSTPAHPAWPS